MNTINNTTTITNDVNDLSLIGNKIGIFPNKTTVISFKDEWIFNKINDIQNNSSFKTPLFIYNNNDYYDDYYSPVITKFYNKSFKNFNSRPDIAVIELGIISDTNDSGIIDSKIQFKTKKNNNLSIFEITPNDNYPYLTCLNFENKNQINIGKASFFTSNQINFKNSCVNINDDFDYLMTLTNNLKPVKIAFENENNKWDMSFKDDLKLTHNSNDLLILNNDGFLTLNSGSNNFSCLNINSIKNRSSVECVNIYETHNEDDTSFNIDSYIKTPVSNLTINSNNYHFDYYDDNFDNNISGFSYDLSTSNFPNIDIKNKDIYNYHINKSNLTFNSNLIINFTTTLNNVELDYRYLETINFYNDSNCIELVPTLKSYNPNLKAKIINFTDIPINYNINGVNLLINYKTPATVNNEVLISSRIINNSSNSNFENYYYSNVNLLTFMTIKDKPSNDYKIKTITNDFIVNTDDAFYNYKITNSIYYYPVPNINITDLELKFSYNYNFRNEINLPRNLFNIYQNSFVIESQIDKSIVFNNSNFYLKNLIETDDLSIYTDATLFKKSSLISSNTVKKVYPIEINNMDITTLELTFTKNNYFEMYDFPDNSTDIYLPITINQFQPHLIFKNKINSQFSSVHKFFSYNSNYDIYLDNKKLISLDSNGSLNTDGNVNINDVIFKGDIYYKKDGILTSITSNLTHIVGGDFYIQKNNISLNSSNIFLNPSILNYGGVIINGSGINNSNNLFEINNYPDNDNFITLKSINNSGYINFWGTNDLFKFGSKNGSFGLWRGASPNDNYLNNQNNLNNVFKFDYINDKFNLDINADIKTSSQFSINDITTYINNALNYKMRVFGNLKVDGVVISSSDKRLKTNINKVENALDKIEKLSGVYFNKIGDDKRQIGLIAQEVNEVVEEAVFKDENGFMNIAYGNLMGLIIEGIKELRNEIKNLKSN